MEYEICEATTSGDLEAVRGLLGEYHEWLGDVVCSLRLAEEIASLPGPYSSPTGTLLLARDASGVAVGAVGIRPHHGDACEMKRLYVRPEARGSGLGHRLAAGAIESARGLGYRTMLLTTLPDSMGVALLMYERLGFRSAERFQDHSHVEEGVRMAYLELAL